MKNLLYLFITIVVAAIFFIVFTTPWQPKDTVKIYFFKNGGMVTVERKAKPAVSLEETAIKQLLKGPSIIEKSKGYFTEIPKNTRFRSIKREGNIVKVDFTKELELYGGGTATVKGLLSQIVYTLTDLEGIEKVHILVNGKEEIALGGEGYIIDKPLSRDDLQE